MAENIKLWEILPGDELKEITTDKLLSEERLENWIERDISVISTELLIIGRQVETDFGGVIDLLCIDNYGDLVIIELKRDKTPREVTAQILEYGSWVKDLSHERVTEIANRYLGDKGSLEDKFKERFDTDLPEILNERHDLLIVASKIDTGSERIINYLSDYYGVGINAVTFEYFNNKDGKEFLTRGFLVEPSEIEYRSKTRTSSKRKKRLSYEELDELANSRGIRPIYQKLVSGLTELFNLKDTTRSSIAFSDTLNDRSIRILSLIPGESDSGKGVRFQVYIDRLADYFGVAKAEIVRAFPANYEESQFYKGASPGGVGYFKTPAEVDSLLTGLRELRSS